MSLTPSARLISRCSDKSSRCLSQCSSLPGRQYSASPYPIQLRTLPSQEASYLRSLSGFRRSFSNTVSRYESDAFASPKLPQTHYHLFPKTLPKGPPPASAFKIDLSSLKREFLQLQAQAHPDKHPPHLKTRAEATSSHINTAYKTLQNPLLRAQYLLSLRDINVAEDETAKVEDPELLMTVLDVREAIEEAQEEPELEPLKVENEARIDQAEQALEACFKNDDMEGAQREAVKLRYWINIRESLQNWEQGVPIILQH